MKKLLPPIFCILIFACPIIAGPQCTYNQEEIIQRTKELYRQVPPLITAMIAAQKDNNPAKSRNLHTQIQELCNRAFIYGQAAKKYHQNRKSTIIF